MSRKKTHSCPICGNHKTFFRDSFWRCNKCFYQFSGPQKNEFTKKYYQEDIGLLVQNVLEKNDKDANLRKYATLALREINKKENELRICDIGCGIGTFLVKLKHSGHSVYGYDINKAQTSFARKTNKLSHVTDAQSLKQYCQKQKIKKNFFDVITCFEVIEHITEINEFVKEIQFYLKPGGLLILSTPNNQRIQMYEKWDYPPVHVSRFKRKNMEILLRKYNLAIKYFNTFNELGYYSGNLIAKMKFSHQALEHMVQASSSIQSTTTASLNTWLFKSLSKTKKAICWVIDIPVYLILSTRPDKGHTMFLVAEKIK